MADSAVAITAGSGTNIDTRTEGTNSNHRQVIVIGDPSTNAGVAPVDATTGLAVNVAAIDGVDVGSGTGGSATPRVIIDSSQIAAAVTTSQTISAGAQLVTLPTDVTVPTGGSVAHDSADSGNPVKVGAKAIASQHGLTLVAASDRTDVYTGLDGIIITRPHTNLESIVSGNASNTDGTSTQVVAASGDASVKTYLTSVILTNTSSSNIYVEMKSGTTVKATIPLPANSGAIFNPPVPLPPNAANEAWNFDPSAATTTVYCSAIGFKSKI